MNFYQNPTPNNAVALKNFMFCHPNIVTAFTEHLRESAVLPGAPYDVSVTNEPNSQTPCHVRFSERSSSDAASQRFGAIYSGSQAGWRDGDQKFDGNVFDIGVPRAIHSCFWCAIYQAEWLLSNSRLKLWGRVGSSIAKGIYISPDAFSLRERENINWGNGSIKLNDGTFVYGVVLVPDNQISPNKTLKRAAQNSDLVDFQAAMCSETVGIKELDSWRKQNASNISRDSLRNLFKQQNPNLKRGPRGPRKNLAK